MENVCLYLVISVTKVSKFDAFPSILLNSDEKDWLLSLLMLTKFLMV